MAANGLKMTLEIVPPYILDRGLSHALPKNRWERIRRGVAEEYGHRCAACGVTSRRSGPLQCHEVWEYDLSTTRPPTPEEVEARSFGGKKKTRWDLVGAKARESVRRGVRRLVGFMPLCGPCHRAKHSEWPCFMLRSVRKYLVARGHDPEPGELLREALLIPCGHALSPDEQRLWMKRVGFLNHNEGTFRSRDRFVEVMNRGIPLAELEAHCLEACALRDSRRGIEWASDYNGYDRLGGKAI